MNKRTTIRRAATDVQMERTRRAAGQRRYLERLTARADLSVLASGEMWR